MFMVLVALMVFMVMVSLHPNSLDCYSFVVVFAVVVQVSWCSVFELNFGLSRV